MLNEMKIGIFGCTADPWTVAHQSIVNEVCKLGFIDILHIVPTIVDYHRGMKNKEKWLSDNQKIACISTSMKSNGYLNQFNISKGKCYWSKDGTGRTDVIIDDCEFRFRNMCMESERKSGIVNELISGRRFIHTLLDLRLRYDSDAEFYTILGTDSMQNFTRWYHYEDILENSRLIAVEGRSGCEMPLDIPIYKTITLSETMSSVSASAVREKYSKMKNGFEKYLRELENGI